jgi:hypothetical protein
MSDAIARGGMRPEFAPVQQDEFFYTAHTIVNASGGALFLKISKRSGDNSNTALRLDENTLALERVYVWDFAEIQKEAEAESRKINVQDVYAKHIYVREGTVHVVLETGRELLRPVRVGFVKEE